MDDRERFDPVVAGGGAPATKPRSRGPVIRFAAMLGHPRRDARMGRRAGLWLGVLCTCMLGLGGCVHSTKAQFTRHYGLGTPAAAPAGEAGAAGTTGKILEVAQISVPEWLSGNAMYYRLDYRNDDRLAAYAQSDWIAPPASLLEPILRRALAGGGWRAVVGPRNPATADASLQLRLDDFSQAFAQPGESTGVLDATATLIDNRNDQVIAQKDFHIEVPSSTPDAQGGAKALAEASRKFAAQLQGWAKAAAGGGSR